MISPARSRRKGTPRRSNCSSTASTIVSISARRPGPTIPQARSPTPGGTTRTWRSIRTRRFACVAGCAHISLFIAGATTTGVGEARGEAGQKIGGSRRNDQDVGGLRFGDVFNGGVEIGFGVFRAPEAGNDLVPGEGGKGKRLHKARSRLRHHHVDVQRLCLQRTYQFRSLVGGNSAGDPDRDLHMGRFYPRARSCS